MHFCIPIAGNIGCHSVPFAYINLATLQPPGARSSLIIGFSDGSSLSNSAFGVAPSGHVGQHDVLSGRRASFSEHVNGGHC